MAASTVQAILIYFFFFASAANFWWQRNDADGTMPLLLKCKVYFVELFTSLALPYECRNAFVLCKTEWKS
jgi:hypothetical protein